jgi:hypothetical protein
VTTCDANDAFGAGQVAPGVHDGVAPSALGARSAGAAAAITATAIAAATMTRTPGTRRRCAVSESVTAPRNPTVAATRYANAAESGSFQWDSG